MGDSPLPETDTYTLWIIPDGAAYALTDGYIAKLSSAYHIPRFEPHVTILGGIRSVEKSLVCGLADGLAPFRVQLASKVEYLNEYFRCLFLRAHKTPELMEAFSEASETFGYEGNPYFPHLSLAYGEFPLHTKREMIRELGAIPRVEFEARSIHLAHASTRLPVSSWKIIDRFPFAKA
jgi:2'-5' RNA ligase